MNSCPSARSVRTATNISPAHVARVVGEALERCCAGPRGARRRGAAPARRSSRRIRPSARPPPLSASGGPAGRAGQPGGPAREDGGSAHPEQQLRVPAAGHPPPAGPPCSPRSRGCRRCCHRRPTPACSPPVEPARSPARAGCPPPSSSAKTCQRAPRRVSASTKRASRERRDGWVWPASTARRCPVSEARRTPARPRRRPFRPPAGHHQGRVVRPGDGAPGAWEPAPPHRIPAPLYWRSTRPPGRPSPPGPARSGPARSHPEPRGAWPASRRRAAGPLPPQGRRPAPCRPPSAARPALMMKPARPQEVLVAKP